MSIEQLALLIFAVVTAGVCWQLRIPRAILWVGLMIASFVASTAYTRAGGDLPEVIAAVTDIAIVLAIVSFGRERWEDFIGYIFIVSAAFNLFEIVQIGWPHLVYIIALEACNIMALLVMIGTAGLEWRYHERADSPTLSGMFGTLYSSLRGQSAHQKKAP